MQLLVNSMPGIVFWKSLDLHYLGANQKFLQFLNLKNQNQLVGKTDAELICSQQKREYLSKFDFLILKTEQAHYSIEERFSQEDGSIITVITDKHPIYDDKHNLIGILCLSSVENDKDSTAQAYLENIIASVPYYIFWKNSNSVYLGCNKKFSSLVNKTPQEVIGRTDYELGWKESEPEVFIEGDKEVMSGNSKVNVEEILLQSDGSKTIMLVSKVPVFDKSEKCIGVLGVSIDITERKKMEQELILAKNAAESANHAKTQFIANMSHDIRTPLSGVIGLSELLEQSLSNEFQKEQAHMLHDSGEELLTMLNGILDDVRADHVSKDDVEELSFDVQECIGDLVRLERPTTTLKNLELVLAIDTSVPQYIVSDRKKIYRILLNLLGNAIKFTQSGKITLEVKCLDKNESKVHLQFGVADTGVGIPKELQDKVFDRFFRVTSSYQGLYKGHGLGLHIAQSYVSLLGGHITLTSEVGVGSTFHFDVSCLIGSAPSLSIDSKTKTIKKAISRSFSDKNRPNFLLVEDNLIALKTLETMVQTAGYSFSSAEHGEKALELVQTQDFDLIITDIGLPGLSGHELTQKIRDWEKRKNKPPTPIIGLTGHARDVAKSDCMACGMNEVYTKPITQALLHEIASCLIEPGIPEQDAHKIESPNPNELEPDLSQPEEELLQLEAHTLFSPKDALQQLNNLELLFELVRHYVSDSMQQDIRLIENAYDQKDWPKIEKIAHKIKSGVAYIGTQKMRYACQYLERYHKAGHTALLDKLYHQLIEVNQETIESLKTWLDVYDKKE